MVALLLVAVIENRRDLVDNANEPPSKPVTDDVPGETLYAGDKATERPPSEDTEWGQNDLIVETLPNHPSQPKLEKTLLPAPDDSGKLNNENRERTELTAEQIYAKASKCLVSIHAKNRGGERISSGSGFIMDGAAIESCYPKYAILTMLGPDVGRERFKLASGQHEGSSPQLAIENLDKLQFGYAFVITNFHVIEAAVSVEVGFTEGEGFEGIFADIEVVAELKDQDIAVLRILGHSFPPGLRLVKSEPPIGQAVYALGNPQGLEGSLSNGIISGYRDFDESRRVIQTTAPISHGSSGGPLLDKYANVIGVVTAYISEGQNLNLAVPSDIIDEAFSSGLCERAVWKGRNSGKELLAFLSDASSRCNARDIETINTENGVEYREKPQPKNMQQAKRQLAQAIDAHNASDWAEAARNARLAEPELPKELKPVALVVEAIALFSMAYDTAKSKVSSSDDWQRSSQLLRRRDDYQRSNTLLRRAIKALPETGGLHARLAYQLGQAKEEIDEKNALDVAIQHCPYDASLYWSRGAVYQVLQSYQLAEADFRKSAELDPKYEYAFAWLARALASQDRFGEAMEAAEQALALGSDDDVRPMIEERRRLKRQR